MKIFTYIHKGARLLKFSKTFKAALAFTLAASAIVVSIPSASAITFKDVDSLGNSKYEISLKDSIYSLANRNIVNGKTETHFAPMAPITRAEVAKMIVKTLELPTKSVVNPKFNDVKTKDWYYPYVAVLANMKIINGYDGNVFKPNNPITRAEMAKLLAMAFDIKVSNPSHPFTDVPKKHYSNEYIAALYENEITTGVSKTNFGYKNNIKRGDVAIFITRIEKFKEPTPPVDNNDQVENDAVVTLNATDYGFKSFNNSLFDNSGIYKKTVSSSSIKLEALKEGQGKVLLKGISSKTSTDTEAFYLVNVETINNKLHVALEKADLYEYLDYSSLYFDYAELGVTFKPAIATLKNAKGEVVNYVGDVTLDEKGFDLTMLQLGTYYLTLEMGAKQKKLTVNVELNNFETKIDLY